MLKTQNMPFKKILISLGLVAFSFLSLKAVAVAVETNNFFAPGLGTYVETDILILGNSIQFTKNETGLYQGAVEVSIIFSQGNNVVAFDKYILNSHTLVDSSELRKNLIDKKRFVLPVGVYTVDFSFKDVNLPENTEEFTQSHIVDFSYDKIQVSDIMLVDNYYPSVEENIFTKSGVHFTPYVTNFYPNNLHNLIIYTEVYNSATVLGDESFLITASIKKFQTEEVQNGLMKYFKSTPKKVNVVFHEFDISNLLSGNYNLVVEVKDKENNLLAIKNLFFQRLHSISTTDLEAISEVSVQGGFTEQFNGNALVYRLRSIIPITSLREEKTIETLIRGKDEALMRQYLHNFWISRNPEAPLLAWENYQKTIDMVNKEFGTNLNYGFETDRGRVFLQYGPPSNILKSDREPGADPYHVWHYASTNNGQNNIRFVFHNADLVTNEYQLIHSTAINEIRNDQWQKIVHGSFGGPESPTDSGDDLEYRDHFGSRSKEIFDE